MAVEIKELVIRAIAVDDQQGNQNIGNSSPSGGLDEEEMLQRIVKACVKEVLAVLNRKNMR